VPVASPSGKRPTSLTMHFGNGRTEGAAPRRRRSKGKCTAERGSLYSATAFCSAKGSATAGSAEEPIVWQEIPTTPRITGLQARVVHVGQTLDKTRRFDKVISALEEPTRSITGCGLWRRLPATCPPTPVRMPAARAATSSRQGTGPAYCVATAPARTRTGYAVRTEQQDPREVRLRITGRDLPVTPMLIHGSGFCRVGQVPLRSPHLPYGFSASVVGRGEQWPYPQGRRWTSVP
jgi:hypothetical protein